MMMQTRKVHHIWSRIKSIEAVDRHRIYWNNKLHTILRNHHKPLTNALKLKISTSVKSSSFYWHVIRFVCNVCLATFNHKRIIFVQTVHFNCDVPKENFNRVPKSQNHINRTFRKDFRKTLCWMSLQRNNNDYTRTVSGRKTEHFYLNVRAHETCAKFARPNNW